MRKAEAATLAHHYFLTCNVPFDHGLAEPIVLGEIQQHLGVRDVGVPTDFVCSDTEMGD